MSPELVPLHETDDNTDASTTRAIEPPLSGLRTLAGELAQMGTWSGIPESEGLHLAIAMTHRLVMAIVRLQAAGYPRQALVDTLADARAVHAESPFARRLQEWPRGYPGDFETVEYLLQQRNHAPEGRLSHFLEQYALDSPIAQQHRNKVDMQARELIRAIQYHDRPESPRFLLLAAGGSPDVRLVEHVLADRRCEITLLDQDKDALAFSANNLPLLRSRLKLVQANVVRGLPGIARTGPFDLVLAGGLFDYLPDRVAISVLRTAATRLLREGGRLMFTNIKTGNPYRPWIEHLADWLLIHRSAADVLDLCLAAGFEEDSVVIDTDRTGLALVITCRRS